MQGEQFGNLIKTGQSQTAAELLSVTSVMIKLFFRDT
jgi:hypothetical protein